MEFDFQKRPAVPNSIPSILAINKGLDMNHLLMKALYLPVAEPQDLQPAMNILESIRAWQKLESELQDYIPVKACLLYTEYTGTLPPVALH